ncbi:hypothetical protein [Delftia acidovorans]|uniref:hypothetical protein n=1 Tax=Delftia acidovorans TaxID=80866 RepID=UPI000BDC8145|nr:hypothetical protein [Delftia acidovorans]SOE37464.1 hypothetical protein SAMN05216519_3512 [Delftia acidovorans]
MGQYTEADAAFIARIKESLLQRQIINANKAAGAMPMQAEPDDRMSTHLTITRDEFRHATGRSKVRAVAWNGLIQQVLDKDVWTQEVGRTENDVTFRYSPPVPASSKFIGVSALEKKNETETGESPRLARPYWE